MVYSLGCTGGTCINNWVKTWAHVTIYGSYTPQNSLYSYSSYDPKSTIIRSTMNYQTFRGPQAVHPDTEWGPSFLGRPLVEILARLTISRLMRDRSVYERWWPFATFPLSSPFDLFSATSSVAKNNGDPTKDPAFRRSYRWDYAPISRRHDRWLCNERILLIKWILCDDLVRAPEDSSLLVLTTGLITLSAGQLRISLVWRYPDPNPVVFRIWLPPLIMTSSIWRDLVQVVCVSFFHVDPAAWFWSWNNIGIGEIHSLVCVEQIIKQLQLMTRVTDGPSRVTK